jgi:transposase
MELRNIYEEKDRDKADQKFKEWIQKTYNQKLEVFFTVANTIIANYENILNFFIHRNTNANAESFNAKIKLFRANLRGVIDIPFFLFRMTKLFA